MHRAAASAIAVLLLSGGWNAARAAQGEADVAARWASVEKAYRQEYNLDQGHKLLNDFIAERPGEVTGVPEALLRMATEETFEVFNLTWRDFAMRNWMAPRFPGGMKDVCALTRELLREEMKTFLISGANPHHREGESKTRAVMREAMRREQWHSRAPGSQDRSDLFHAWPEAPVRRIFALQRTGRISDSDPVVMDANILLLYARLRQGRYHEAAGVFDQVVRASGNDAHWMFARARFHHWMGSTRAGELFRELFRLLDDPHAESHLSLIRQQTESYRLYRMDPVVQPSWLARMITDEPADTWAKVERGQVRGEEILVDSLVGQVIAEDTVLPRKNHRGGARAWSVLCDRLNDLPPGSLDGLRAFQEKKCGTDRRAKDLPRNTNRELKALFERFPYSHTALQGLLLLGRRDLEAGRGQFARRTFRQVLDFSDDPELRAQARVGWWVAISQGGDSRELAAAFDEVKAGERFPWLGGKEPVEAIRKRLEKGRVPAPEPEPPSALEPQVVHIPAGLLWTRAPTGADAGLGWLTLQVAQNRLLVASQNALCWYDAGDTRVPLWSQIGAGNAGGGYRAGEFRPVLENGKLFTRYSYGPLPTHIARLEAATGRLEWGRRPAAKIPKDGRGMPLGDPALVERLIYGLNWSSDKEVGLFHTCMNADDGSLVWQAPIPQIGGFHSRAHNNPGQHGFGNRVTVHDGLIYTAPNRGMICCSDARDGTLVWAHEYGSTERSAHHAGGWGAAPEISGDTVICIPRDSNSIICLDRRTGRLLWNNALVVPRYALGMVEGRYVVLGNSMLAGLEAATGRIAWSVPVIGEPLGWPKRVGASVYLGSADGLRRVDARTGLVREAMPWPFEPDRIRNFAVHGKKLYLVTDEPVPADRIGKALPERKTEGVFPLEPAWTIERSKPQLHVPEKDAGLEGRVLVCSDNMVECIDGAGGARIAWQRFMGPKPYRVMFHDGKAILFVTSWRDRFKMIALDGKTGRTVWESKDVLGLNQIQKQFDSVLMLTERNRLAAADLGTGNMLWDRIVNSYGIDYGHFFISMSGPHCHFIHCPAPDRTPQHHRGRINWVTTDRLTGLREALTPVEVPVANPARHFRPLRIARFGARSAFVTAHAVDAEGKERRLLYRLNLADRTYKPVREGITLQSVFPPYLLFNTDQPAGDKKHEVLVLREDDPSYEKRFAVESDRNVVSGKLLMMLAADTKSFQAYDLETGARRVNHVEEGDSKLVTFECDGEELFVAARNPKLGGIRLALYHTGTWKLVGEQQIDSFRQAAWPDRWRPQGDHEAGRQGAWMVRRGALLLLCGEDGIYAFTTGSKES